MDLGGDRAFDVQGRQQPLFSSSVQERDWMPRRAILAGGVWNGYPLEQTRRETRICVNSVLNKMVMGTSFGSGPFFPLCSIQLRDSPGVFFRALCCGPYFLALMSSSARLAA